ncbi:LacI family DNA-binding transcriptional regulator [Emticicia sp. SJ17W-69]|uniref:LacI family DNA-binding transcriptional regulator n=1 Tax=Emticicia sp. SJ17W-69 TaxID=3421657 RepID=UPI003EC0A0A7
MQRHQATIKEIAQELGISISTVSRALQNNPRIGLRTRERVWEVAKLMHYVPNPAAILLKKNKTSTIGVVLPYLQEEFFSMAITGIEDVALEKGYNVVVSQSREKFEREEKALKSFLSSRVDGVIASVAAETSNYSHFKELESYGTPLVFFDRVPRNLEANKVRCSITQGAFEAVEFLVNKGIQRIALLNGPTSMEVSDERLNGYLLAIKKFKLQTTPNYIKSTDLSKEQSVEKMLELLALKEPPQAILTFNDYLALYAMQVCKQKNLVPNKDILFVSFANLPMTFYLDNPPLASVDQFAYRMGIKSAELLISIIENPSKEMPPYQELILETKLVVH